MRDTVYFTLPKAFYGVLKSSDRYIRFALLTGVTKFSKISVFSDLNNLEDLSLQSNYQTLCGITHKELLSLLSEEIKDLASKHNKTVKEIQTQLAEWYDGYHFSNKGEVYPLSSTILYCYSKIRIIRRNCTLNTGSHLQQINKKQYALPFETDSRKVYKIGANFSANCTK